MTKFYKTTLYILLLLISILILFYRVFYKEIPVPYHMDYIRFLTQQIRVVEDIKSGDFPLWNPYLLCGMPTATNVMTNLFSPFLPLYFLFKDPVFVYVFIVIFEMFCIALCTFFMMRSVFNVSRMSAYISAIIFCMGGFMFWIHNIAMKSILDLLFLYPLSFLFYNKLRKNPSFKWAIPISFVLALGFVNCSGSILQYGYNMIFLFLFHLLFLLINRNNIKRELKISFYLCAAFLLNIGLSAFMFLPVYESVNESTRFTGAILYTPPNVFPIIISFFYPDIWTTLFYIKANVIYNLNYGVVGYCGIPAFILAVMGSFLSKDKKRIFFIVIPVLFFIVWPLYSLIYRSTGYLLPEWLRTGNHLFYPLYLFTFSIAILSGLGFNFIQKYYNKTENTINPRLKKALYICIFLFLSIYCLSFTGFIIYKLGFKYIAPFVTDRLSGILYNSESFERSKDFYIEKIHFILSLINRKIPVFLFSNLAKIVGLILLVKILRSKKVINRLLLNALALCVLFDFVFLGYQSMIFLPRDYYYPELPEIKYLEQNIGKDIFRVGVLYEDSDWFWQHHPNAGFKEFYDFAYNKKKSLHENILIRFGIQKIGAFCGLCPDRPNRYFSLLNQKTGYTSHGIFLTNFDSHLLDLVNMKYVLSSLPLADDKFLEKFKGEKYIVYENKKVFDRAFFVSTAVYINDDDELLKKLQNNKFDFKNVVLISSKENQGIEFKPNDAYNTSDNTVVIKEYKTNEVTVQVINKQAGWLVLSDTYYPGWKVYINGKQGKIYPANYLMRGVYLDPGKNTIRFIYFSDWMRRGILISFVALIVTISLFVVSLIRSKSKDCYENK